MSDLKNTTNDELIAIVKKLYHCKKAKKYKKTNQTRLSNKTSDTKIDKTLKMINHNELKSKRTNGDILIINIKRSNRKGCDFLS